MIDKHARRLLHYCFHTEHTSFKRRGKPTFSLRNSAVRCLHALTWGRWEDTQLWMSESEVRLLLHRNYRHTFQLSGICLECQVTHVHAFTVLIYGFTSTHFFYSRTDPVPCLAWVCCRYCVRADQSPARKESKFPKLLNQTKPANINIAVWNEIVRQTSIA